MLQIVCQVASLHHCVRLRLLLPPLREDVHSSQVEGEEGVTRCVPGAHLPTHETPDVQRQKELHQVLKLPEGQREGPVYNILTNKDVLDQLQIPAEPVCLVLPPSRPHDPASIPQ